MIAGDAEDSLDYLNVYFPYADDHLTLKLTDNPEQRPIAAEFLARFIDETRSSFVEELQPMSPWGPVRIGRTIIRYGNSPVEDVDFKYRLERRGERLWLVLESKLMRLELLKLFPQLGGIGESRVVAPIRGYTPQHISELRTRYEKMKKEIKESPTK